MLCAPAGNVLFETGACCRACGLCRSLGEPEDVCVVSRARAWREAERFGGKYIYACPIGLTCIAANVRADFDVAANITAGPFLMVEEEDFIHCELAARALDASAVRAAREALRPVPRIEPGQAEAIARQLLLSIGGTESSFRIGDLLARQGLERFSWNGDAAAPSDGRDGAYPIALERELLDAIRTSDRARAERLLNELLGHIFFLTGGEFGSIRARIRELLVLSSRAAIDAGADETQILSLCRRYVEQMGDIYDVDKLCYWLSAVLNRFFACLFDCGMADAGNPMPAVLAYLRRNGARRVTLTEAAAEAHLSPSYFSRLFREQTGHTFGEYMRRERVERAKRLLVYTDLDMAEIAAQTGFFDQSHLTKAFKNAAGMTPGTFRRRRKRGYDESRGS